MVEIQITSSSTSQYARIGGKKSVISLTDLLSVNSNSEKYAADFFLVVGIRQHLNKDKAQKAAESAVLKINQISFRFKY